LGVASLMAEVIVKLRPLKLAGLMAEVIFCYFYVGEIVLQ
jgi:hypothetical protein